MTRGGKRKGAGRKAGSKNLATLDRETVLAHLRGRTMRSADVLWDSQMTLARGQTFLYRIDKEWITNGKNKDGTDKGYYRNKKPVLVTDEQEIRDYIERETNRANGDIEDDHDESAAYYFLTAKEPNNQAIDSMLDRTLGKSTQPLSGPNGDDAIPVNIVGMKIVEEE